ncbi:hypothetical protein LDENG_00250930 [Lucifuga dentata]|nr:hypothetical protein LDENG_00250930 [Lucifuga dentata]
MTARAALILLLLHVSTHLCLLPSPSGVSMESIDMRHILRWRPLQSTCSTAVLYSVQFQGEFELRILNGRWVDAPECQKIPHTRCDLTFDLGSDSDYNIRVRGQCGWQVSTWTSLSAPFNRRDTVLTAPQVTMTTVSNALQVSFNQLPLTAAIRVTMWKRGDENKAQVYKVPAEKMLLHIGDLQEGAEYCVRAQTVLHAKLSSSTQEQCVSIIGPDAAWKMPTTVSLAVIVAAGLLFAVLVVHCHADACYQFFHEEPLPPVLEHFWTIQVPPRPEDELERCDLIDMVLNLKSEPAGESEEHTAFTAYLKQ